jgi:hypothetical protein
MRLLGGLAVLMALVVTAGCGDAALTSSPAPSGPSALPEPRHTAAATTPGPVSGTPDASEPLRASPSRSPGRPESVLDRLPTLQVPASDIVRVEVPTAFVNAQTGLTWGSRLYVAVWASRTVLRVTRVDLASGDRRAVKVRVPARVRDEAICVAAARDGWLVLMGVRDVGSGDAVVDDCTGYEGDPRAWRLLAVPLDATGLPSGAATRVAAGISRHEVFPTGKGNATTELPAVALDGDEIAYSFDATTRARPWRSRIVVAALRTGRVARRLATDGQPYHLALDGGTLAWSERTDRGDRVSVAVRISTAGHPAPVTFWRHARTTSGEAPAVILGESRIAWDDPATGIVWSSRVAQMAPAVISPPMPQDKGWCRVGDIVGAFVIAGCEVSYMMGDDAWHAWQATLAWSPEAGNSVLVGDPAIEPGEGSSPGNGGGWLVAQDVSRASDTTALIVAASLRSLAR